jgi:hypothetical protein
VEFGTEFAVSAMPTQLIIDNDLLQTILQVVFSGVSKLV